MDRDATALPVETFNYKQAHDPPDSAAPAAAAAPASAAAAASHFSRAAWGTLSICFTYVLSDTRRRRLAALAAILVVALVVGVVQVLSVTLTKTPLIFLRFAETKVGETDLLLTVAPARVNLVDSLRTPDIRFNSTVPIPVPNSQYVVPLLDYNAFQRSVVGVGVEENPDVEQKARQAALELEEETVAGMAPRWLALARVRRPDQDPREGARVLTLLYDDTREREADIGRTWSRPPLGPLEAYLSKGVVDQLSIPDPAGYTALLDVDVAEILDGLNVARDVLTNASVLLRFLGQDPDSVLTVKLPFPMPPTTKLNQTVPLPNSDPPRDVWFAYDPVDNAVSFPAIALQILTSGITEAFPVTAQFQVIDQVENPDGKWPNRLGNVLALEATHIMALSVKLVDSFLVNYEANSRSGPLVDVALRQAVEQFLFENLTSVSHYSAVTTIGVQSKTRVGMYTGSADHSTNGFSEFTNRLSESTGVDYPTTNTLPIKEILDGSDLVKIFLDQVFLVVFLVIVILSGVLVYTLALAEVDDRTYEFGMLRALGLKQADLVLILLMRAARAALPGVVLGVLLGVVCIGGVNRFLGSVADLGISLTIPPSTVVYIFVVGFFVPFIANIIPTRRALALSLKDAIDIGRDKANTQFLRIERAEDLGIRLWEISIAVLLLIAGALFYFVLPSAFLSLDFRLLFGIMNIALLGMLLGLTIIVQVIQPFMERWTLRVLTPSFLNDSKLRPLVQRNLASHRRRNRFVALLVTLSVAFVFFAGVLIAQQAIGIEDGVKVFLGADISVSSVSADDFLDEQLISNALNERIQKGQVENFAYVTEQLTRLEVSSLAGQPSTGSSMRCFGVSDTFFQTIFEDRTLLAERAATKPGRWNLDDYLPEGGAVEPSWPGIADYQEDLPSLVTGARVESRRGLGDLPRHLLVGEAMRAAYSFTVDTPLAISLSGEKLIARGVLFGRKIAGFFFTSYEVGAGSAPVLVSEQTFQILRHLRYNATQAILDIENGLENEWEPANKSRCLVRLDSRLRGGARMDVRNAVVAELRTLVNDAFEVLDLEASIESVTEVRTGLTAFFIAVAVVADVLCFIMIYMSFRSNAKESALEIAVLRATGVTRAQVTRMSFYESFSLVGSSVILGLCVGALMSVTLSLQYGVLSETRFGLIVPLRMLIVLVCIIVALTAIVPLVVTRRVTRRPIGLELRSTTE